MLKNKASPPPGGGGDGTRAAAQTAAKTGLVVEGGVTGLDCGDGSLGR